jgi:lipopolysaccharide assembly outer membrane protein LptD (OstA)
MRALGWVVGVVLAVGASGPVRAQQPLEAPQGGPGKLQADYVRYDARNRLFEARGNVRLVTGDVTVTSETLVYEEKSRTAWAEGNARVVQGTTTLTAASVRYESESRVVHARQGVTVTQPDLTLRSEALVYDLRGQVVDAEGKVVVEQPDQTLRADTLNYRVRGKVVTAKGSVELKTKTATLTGETLWADLENKKATVTGPAKLVRKGGPPPRGREQDRVLVALAKEDTTFTAAEEFRFSWKETEEAEAKGDARVVQVDKEASGDFLRYSEREDRVELVGRARLHQRSGQWLVREKLVRPPETEEDRKTLETPATLTAERVVLFLGTRNAVAVGDVKVTQGERLATGDRAEYEDTSGRIVLSGRRVRLKREDGAWLEAQRVVLSMKEDTFEAFGSVETHFTVKP